MGALLPTGEFIATRCEAIVAAGRLFIGTYSGNLIHRTAYSNFNQGVPLVGIGRLDLATGIISPIFRPRIRAPSTTLFACDATSLMVTPARVSPIAPRHRERATVVWADGHVSEAEGEVVVSRPDLWGP